MIAAPASATRIPASVPRFTRSSNSTRAPAATKIGDAVTSVTLAATDVSFTDGIHSAKCRAKIAPESTAIPTCPRVSARNSARRSATAAGSTAAAANALR
jgi:hypothetical protein